MPDGAYWQHFWRRRLSRRRLLAGASLTVGGLAAAACGGNNNPSGGSPARSRAELDLVYPTDARQNFVPAPPEMHGGTLRVPGFEPVVLDRYDPHQTQFGPMYANLSAVFSKLYMYASHEEPTWENILPDLAESAPEMIGDPPDTYVIKLRKGVRFHESEAIRRNFPALAGRELTADDVIFSFDRQRNPDSPQVTYYYRRNQYQTIDAIEKIDDYTVRIRTKGPVAPFYHYLADTNAMIVPREVVDQAKDTLDVFEGPTPEERMIGTGPFMWSELKWGIEFKAVRNPLWFGWDDPDLRRPYLDAYVISGTSLDDATLEALFRKQAVDAAFSLENPDWIFGIKDEVPELVMYQQQSSVWLNSRLKCDCPPFSDIRVRRALHLATERQQMIDAMWGRRGAMVGPVGGAIKYWALPQEELESLPGYRMDAAEREQDIADARALYEAAGSPEIPRVWFGDQPISLPAYTGSYKETLNKNLGADVQTFIQSYVQILQGFLRECDQTQMSLAYDNGWIDLDDWLFPYFYSGGAKNSLGVSDPELDAMLDGQRREFDFEKRRALGYEIQRYILGEKGDKPAALSRLDYITAFGPSVSWPYYRNRVAFPWYGNAHWFCNTWLDRDDPRFGGRATEG